MTTQTPRSITIADRAARTCVWMDAGVLTFKLCDRDFDCEHCPLDAALHGTSPAPSARERQETGGGEDVGPGRRPESRHR